MSFQRTNLVFISIFITLGTLASHATSPSLYEASLAEKHEQWMAKHGRVYPNAAEKEMRFGIFRKNVEYVEKFNNEGNKTYKLNINRFSDMTNEEFRRHHTGFKMPPGLSSTSSNFSYQSLAATHIPTSVDWREQQAVTPIKNQNSCSASWAFTVAAAVEGLTKIKTGQLISLSEQQLVDCNDQNSGCDGGSVEYAYSYVVQNGGLAREETYPYQAMDMGTCDTNKESKHAAQITGYISVPSRSENDLQKAVAMQPVSVGITANGQDFQMYGSGVFSSDCGTGINHAVTAIGYGTTEDGTPYWLMKNSWGEAWGESGYMRILRNSDAPEGMCGLALNSVYPTAPVLAPKPTAPVLAPKPTAPALPPKPTAPALPPKPTAPVLPPKPTAPVLPPKPTAPALPPKTTAPALPPKTTAPVLPPKPTAPVLPPKPTAPALPPKPTAPALPPKPTAPVLPSKQGKKSNTKRNIIIIIVVVTAFVTMLLGGICIFFRVKKPRVKLDDVFSGEISLVESLQYNFEDIRSATDDFSDENKLGQGGFGAVYKGRLYNEQYIAVKKLSKSSQQGDREFKNEVTLVAQLQHRNLVRLLGFCLKGEERLLIYEYIPNKSLDHFIFDPTNHEHLDWETRYKIIEGIVRGLLYLHEDSRLRIIHRDLKASNILLDEDMKPKISDFGMARLFVMDQTQGDTKTIVGTYGYMAPEYASHGRFSIKSDVFSFGVLVLEIITGKKSGSFRNGENEDNLLSYAWRNWRDDTTLNIIDPMLTTGSRSEIMRCIQIGLLCVQENLNDRPTIGSVVSMLNSHSLKISLPSRPPYYCPYNTETNTSGSGFRLTETSDKSQRSLSRGMVSDITEIHPR